MTLKFSTEGLQRIAVASLMLGSLGVAQSVNAGVMTSARADISLEVLSISNPLDAAQTDFSGLSLSLSYASYESQSASGGASGGASSAVSLFSATPGDVVDSNQLQVGQGMRILSEASGSAPDSGAFDFSSLGDWVFSLDNQTGSDVRVEFNWSYELLTDATADNPTGVLSNLDADYGRSIATSDRSGASGFGSVGGVGGNAVEVQSGFGFIPILYPDFVSHSQLFTFNLGDGGTHSISRPVEVSAVGRSAVIATSVPEPSSLLLLIGGLAILARRKNTSGDS
jgi:hypothetical protein